MEKKYKPRVALFLTATEWFWQVAGSSSEFQAMVRQVQDDAESIRRTLENRLELLCRGVLHSKNQWEEMVSECLKEEIDLLILRPMMWDDDTGVHLLYRNLRGIPLVLWCDSTYPQLPKTMTKFEMWRASGTLSGLQSSGVLKKLGWQPIVVAGSHLDEKTLDRLERIGRVAQLKRKLKETRIGYCPYRCDMMEDQYIDEFYLHHKIGPKVEYFSVAEIEDVAKRLDESEINNACERLQSQYDVIVPMDSLRKAMRAQLGLQNLVMERKFDLVCLNEVVAEMYKRFDARPALDTAPLFDQNIIVGLEGDLGATLCMFIGHALTHNPPIFCDLWTYDPQENCLLGGHSGPANSRIAESDSIRITADTEFVDTLGHPGAQVEFAAKAGQVTFFSALYADDRMQLSAVTGESTGQKRLLEFPTIHAKLDVPVREFYERACTFGVDHHWVAVHGDIVEELRLLSKMMDFQFLDCL